MAFIELNNPKYLAFGAVCMLLQLVPGASILFLYTNTVGAALWAVEMEKQGLTPHGEDKSGMELSERVQDGKKTSNGESRKDL